ncbi:MULTISPECIES: hypothetical protein [unclassified Brevibacterium]|uniref:hypothetical protein n=1 Tax=unclassified Brevibacterium TaxID=2614124 RepID=UPI0010C7A337|nr:MULTISPECIES: hypothetical protein [unclassified Brevibacterium]MCK1802965.1 hypothetical protein [Brevibacterium sp. R8603A2]QCP04202.1 hypothetical protein FDF13_01830 [Brevibacterium sp. CS2]
MFVEAARHVRRNRQFASGVEVDPAVMFGGSPGVGLRNPGTRFLVLLPVADAYRLADLIVDAAERASDAAGFVETPPEDASSAASVMYESDNTSPASLPGVE